MIEIARAVRRCPRTCWTAVLVAAALLALWGCEPMVPRVDPEKSPFRGRPPEELAALRSGRDLYVAKCSGCHGLYAPSRGTREDWDRWVHSMASRSHLETGDPERILAYLSMACRW